MFCVIERTESARLKASAWEAQAELHVAPTPMWRATIGTSSGVSSTSSNEALSRSEAPSAQDAASIAKENAACLRVATGLPMAAP
eukprot:CAMPEP_0198561140 /NCGR_PEP_ID=MMETSP1462-20131121/94969_1 /TAXON_ID=1333877 /ORGANISM="Brandtodinium nutriculum, Strain RCC3387" /LENGTH=84 /DNA_ID=CAMNT_0044292029 /DNA_START=411 /DNA_END=662 /DNA_ORIENTATION=-